MINNKKNNFYDKKLKKNFILNLKNLVKTIIKDEISFEHQINLLVNFQTPIEMPQLIQWEIQESCFKNFICSAVMRAVKAKYQMTAMNEENDVDIIESLLKPRIYAYAQNPVNNFAIIIYINQKKILNS